LHSFKKDVYDLVLLDLKMPKMNGVDLGLELQNIEPNLFFRFFTAASGVFIENLKTKHPDIEEYIIYKPLWLNEIRIPLIHFYLIDNLIGCIEYRKLSWGRLK
jgi:response regulator RpfG family c-di-GMP phosphodiesterase